MFDSSGNLLVAAQDGNQIISINPAGVATVIAGSTTAGYVNGPASSAQFNYPSDVRVDGSGNLFIVDLQNNAIRKITSGVVSTFAGSAVSGNTPGYANGVGTAAIFNSPGGLAIGPGGVIYVCDMNNHDIRQIMPDGTVTLLAGSPAQAVGDADGTGTAAGFSYPDYIYIDNTGTGYIAELAGNRIRKIVLTGYSITGTLPPGLSFDPATGIISGTPAGTSPSTNYTVTAYNTGGISSTIINITVAPATNTSLSGLTVSTGTLSPVFTTATKSYIVSVPNVVTSIQLTPTTSDGTAIVTINGSVVASGTLSPAIPLSVGSNPISITVVDNGGTTVSNYTVTVTRAASANAKLSSFKTSAGVLTPGFNNTINSYTRAVPNATTSITFTPSTADPTATVTVNGTTVTSGTASAAIPLNVGDNVINTVVTAQNGTTTITYTVTVTRAAAADATLASLAIGTGTLKPAFAPTTTVYAVAVGNGTSSITVTPTTNDPTATVKVNGVAVTSGTASAPIALVAGANTITTVVTAQNGVTTKSYKITVNRAASTNAKLLSLTTSSGVLSPAFNNTVTSYTRAVPNSTTSITFKPTAVDTNATITVNGVVVASGTSSASQPLVVGSNTENIKVTAQDGVTSITYVVTVNRATGPLNTVYQPVSVSNPEEKPNLDDDIILVHQSLSPNGDGINDFLQIDGILAYPDNKLQIMNRSGQLIFEAKNYDNSTKVFDGHSTKTGAMQLPGTYFYSLDYVVNGLVKHKTGFIVLKY